MRNYDETPYASKQPCSLNGGNQQLMQAGQHFGLVARLQVCPSENVTRQPNAPGEIVTPDFGDETADFVMSDHEDDKSSGCDPVLEQRFVRQQGALHVVGGGSPAPQERRTCRIAFRNFDYERFV
jgi:hypothetical protein